MEKIKQSIVLVLAFLVLVGAVFFTGFYVGSKRGAVIAGEFEKRLGDITAINQQLQDENKRLADLNRKLTVDLESVSSRLDRAKDIIDGFSSQVTTDGDTIQRTIETVSKLEQLLSVIFESK